VRIEDVQDVVVEGFAIIKGKGQERSVTGKSQRRSGGILVENSRHVRIACGAIAGRMVSPGRSRDPQSEIRFPEHTCGPEAADRHSPGRDQTIGPGVVGPRGEGLRSRQRAVQQPRFDCSTGSGWEHLGRHGPGCGAVRWSVDPSGHLQWAAGERGSADSVRPGWHGLDGHRRWPGPLPGRRVKNCGKGIVL